MKLFKFLLFFVTITTLTISCEPDALEAIENNLQINAHKNKKDIIDDDKDIDDLRDFIPNTIDSLKVD